MIEALKASANGEIKKHLVNIDVYLHNPVGIGEHSNIMAAVEQELDGIAEKRIIVSEFMNDVTIFIFGLSFAAVVGATFAFMWKMTGAVLEDVKKPPKIVHPEMKEVQDGDELLVFKGLEDSDDK